MKETGETKNGTKSGRNKKWDETDEIRKKMAKRSRRRYADEAKMTKQSRGQYGKGMRKQDRENKRRN